MAVDGITRIESVSPLRSTLKIGAQGAENRRGAQVTEKERKDFPDEQTKCLACKYLPCCLGGCPMKRMLTGEAECPSALFDPDGFALSCLKDSAMKPRQR